MGSFDSFVKKGIIILVIAIIGFFGAALWKEYYKKSEIDGEIVALKKEAEKIERENMKMEERIKYLASRDYQEIQAKDKLNMQNPGEKLIIISRNYPEKKEAEPENNFKTFYNESTPNYEKWWKYFFQKQN